MEAMTERQAVAGHPGEDEEDRGEPPLDEGWEDRSMMVHQAVVEREDDRVPRQGAIPRQRGEKVGPAHRRRDAADPVELRGDPSRVDPAIADARLRLGVADVVPHDRIGKPPDHGVNRSSRSWRPVDLRRRRMSDDVTAPALGRRTGGDHSSVRSRTETHPGTKPAQDGSTAKPHSAQASTRSVPRRTEIGPGRSRRTTPPIVPSDSPAAEDPSVETRRGRTPGPMAVVPTISIDGTVLHPSATAARSVGPRATVATLPTVPRNDTARRSVMGASVAAPAQDTVPMMRRKELARVSTASGVSAWSATRFLPVPSPALA